MEMVYIKEMANAFNGRSLAEIAKAAELYGDIIRRNSEIKPNSPQWEAADTFTQLAAYINRLLELQKE